MSKKEIVKSSSPNNIFKSEIKLIKKQNKKIAGGISPAIDIIQINIL